MSDVDRRSELATTTGRNACHCITCGDVAEPMRVLQVDEDRALALCEDEAGTRASVEVLLVGAVAPGDALLVHAGTAISRVSA
jgi:hydrogenase maturation factor